MIQDLILVVDALIEEVGGCPEHVADAWARVCAWKPTVIELSDDELEAVRKTKKGG